ncbi:MAG: DUF1311 domain-containing protein [Planctomycetes bacterium]|nr:DUF1311 domain-containing protein [Planctomycetota bacterium]
MQQKACLNTIAKRCFKAVGNGYDSTIRDCNRREEAAWDGILNARYKELGENLGAPQMKKLRDEQRAWIRKRDKCNALYEQMGGTMAHPRIAQCLSRETSQRAIYLINYRPK